MSDLASRRDLRVDFFRGVALLMIFVSHVPGNVFDPLTSANFGFSDAAEIFVFLAGYASALAYGRDFLERGWRAGSVRVLRRAGQLYWAHLLSAIAAIAIVAAAAIAAGDPGYHAWINLAPVFDNTGAAVVGLLTLGHQPGYFNILPLYIVLLLALPAMFAAARRSPTLLLAASAGLWFAAGMTHLNLPHYPTHSTWFLDPFAWQLIFALGLVCGLRARRGPVVGFHPILFAACCGYLLLALVSVQGGLWIDWDLGPANMLIAMDKGYLPPLRLLHFLALAYVAVSLARRGDAFAGAGFRPFVLLGQHALPVFCLGSVAALGAQILRFERQGGAWDDVLLIGCGIVLQLCLATWLSWQKRRPVPGVLRPTRSASPG